MRIKTSFGEICNKIKISTNLRLTNILGQFAATTIPVIIHSAVTSFSQKQKMQFQRCKNRRSTWRPPPSTWPNPFWRETQTLHSDSVSPTAPAQVGLWPGHLFCQHFRKENRRDDKIQLNPLRLDIDVAKALEKL